MKRCYNDVTRLAKDSMKLESELLNVECKFDHYIKLVENCKKLKKVFSEIEPMRIYVVLKVGSLYIFFKFDNMFVLETMLMFAFVIKTCVSSSKQNVLIATFVYK